MSRIINIVARGKSAKSGDWVEAAEQPAPRVDGYSHYEPLQDTAPQSHLSVPQLIERRLIALDESSIAGRELRKLRTQVLYQMREQQWRVLGVSSPAAGSGRAFFAANLAAAMAQEGQQRVTLVDMDLRLPKLQHYFGLEPGAGVRDVLERRAGPVASLQATALDQLRILPATSASEVEPERFYGRELSELLPALLEQDNNQVIVVRLPPVLESGETQTYMPAMDCGICVLKEGLNTPQQLEQTLAVLKQKAFLGAVFNRAAPIRR